MGSMNNNEETLTRKARTSLSNFFHPANLKRKRSFNSSISSEPIAVEEEPAKKKIKVITKLIEKIALTIHSVTDMHRQKKKRDSTSTLPRCNNKQEDDEALFRFEYNFSLPTIDWTNGCLGILSEHLVTEKEPIKKKEEEESIFYLDDKDHLLEFPIPPPSPTLFQHFNNRRKRQDSCPPKFNSLIIIEEEESDNESILPLTPTSSIIQNNALVLKKNIEKFDILHHCVLP